MKGNRVIKDQCTCMKTVYDTNRWNEGFKDDIFERHDDECSEV